MLFRVIINQYSMIDNQDKFCLDGIPATSIVVSSLEQVQSSQQVILFNKYFNLIYF
jgi:hypothetical protein